EIVGINGVWHSSRENSYLRSVKHVSSRCRSLPLIAVLAAFVSGVCPPALAESMKSDLQSYTLNYDTPTDPDLQKQLEAIDARLRAEHGIGADQTAVGVLDLKTLRLAMVRPDRIDYAASVPKIGILLAWFETHPEIATNLDAITRHELGL